MSGCAEEAASERNPEQRYEGHATVLANAEHGPELCLIVRESYPPQCEGQPATNLDWADVQNKESSGETTWADLQLVGTYDGTTFTLTDTPSPATSRPEPTPMDLGSPCPEPAGGWRAADPGKATEADRQAATEHARAASDVAATWLDGEILNLAFTRDLERHEREARERWGGPLCVTRMEHALRDLQRAQTELSTKESVDRLQSVLTAIIEPANRVEVNVLIAYEDLQRNLDERYGSGAVKLLGAFKPAPA